MIDLLILKIIILGKKKNYTDCAYCLNSNFNPMLLELLHSCGVIMVAQLSLLEYFCESKYVKWVKIHGPNFSIRWRYEICIHNHGVNQTSVALWIAFNLIPMTLTPQDVDETCTIFSSHFFFFLRACICYFLFLAFSMFY